MAEIGRLTDPMMQRAAAASLDRLLASADSWRTRRRARNSGHGVWTEAMEFELQGLEGAVRNGIRDVKWSLVELDETLQLLKRRGSDASDIVESESLNLRQIFLDTSRATLDQLEDEVCRQSDCHASVNEQQNSAADESEQSPQKMPKKQAKKSVSWHRHTRASDGEVRRLDKCSGIETAGKSGLKRMAAALCRCRLWISVTLVVALLLIVLFALSMAKSRRLKNSASNTEQTTAAPLYK